MGVKAEDADGHHGAHTPQRIVPDRDAAHEAVQLAEVALHLGHAPPVGARPGQRELLPATRPGCQLLLLSVLLVA